MENSQPKPKLAFREVTEADRGDSFKMYYAGFYALPDRKTITARKAGFKKIIRAGTPNNPTPRN